MEAKQSISHDLKSNPVEVSIHITNLTMPPDLVNHVLCTPSHCLHCTHCPGCVLRKMFKGDSTGLPTLEKKSFTAQSSHRLSLCLSECTLLMCRDLALFWTTDNPPSGFPWISAWVSCIAGRMQVEAKLLRNTHSNQFAHKVDPQPLRMQVAEGGCKHTWV